MITKPKKVPYDFAMQRRSPRVSRGDNNVQVSTD